MSFKATLLFLVLFVFCSASSLAQRVFVVKTNESADVTVYVSDYPLKVDLLVATVSSASQARHNIGRWYFDRTPYTADLRVKFTTNESEADLKICFVQLVTQTGWLNPGKSFLLD